jgi:hypothetical protein
MDRLVRTFSSREACEMGSQNTWETADSCKKNMVSVNRTALNELNALGKLIMSEDYRKNDLSR